MTENKKLNEFKRPPIKIVMQSSLKVKRKEDAESLVPLRNFALHYKYLQLQ